MFMQRAKLIVLVVAGVGAVAVTGLWLGRGAITGIGLPGLPVASDLVIEVTSPNGGERWMLNNAHTIKWSPDQGYAYQNQYIEAYLDKSDDGLTFTAVGRAKERGKGSIQWDGEIDDFGKFPAPGNNYYIRVVDKKTGLSDRSNGPFELLPADYITADLKIETGNPIRLSDDQVEVPEGESKLAVQWTSKNASVCKLGYYTSGKVFKWEDGLPASGTKSITVDPAFNSSGVDSVILICSNNSIEGSGSDKIALIKKSSSFPPPPPPPASTSTQGDVSVFKAADDSDSEAGIILAGGERTLAKFRFTAVNENMTVKKLHILINNSTSSTLTTPSTPDDVSTIKLYVGAEQVGSASGYSVQASGASTSVAVVENLNWIIPKDSAKTLTVRGVVSSIGQSGAGADTGTAIYAHIMRTGFEARGATYIDTIITSASGNKKVIYKTKPTITVSNPGSVLANGEVPVLRFTIVADALGQIAWKKAQFEVDMVGARMDAVHAAPGTNGNVKIVKRSSGAALDIGRAFSGSNFYVANQSNIGGGTTGYVTLILADEAVVAAGTSEEYELSLSFSGMSATSSAQAAVSMYRFELGAVGGRSFAGVESATNNGSSSPDGYDTAPSFIWSDYSNAVHSASTADWANGVYVATIPSSSVVTKR